MTDWPAHARAFSRPTSRPREKRPLDEVGQYQSSSGLLGEKHEYTEYIPQ